MDEKKSIGHSCPLTEEIAEIKGQLMEMSVLFAEKISDYLFAADERDGNLPPGTKRDGSDTEFEEHRRNSVGQISGAFQSMVESPMVAIITMDADDHEVSSLHTIGAEHTPSIFIDMASNMRRGSKLILERVLDDAIEQRVADAMLQNDKKVDA